MIYKKCIITIAKNGATLDEDIYLYRLDKNVELHFTIVNNKYKFDKSDMNNIISQTNAAYFQIRLYKNADIKYTFAIQPTDAGKAILKITDDLIDDPIEVGEYDFQISLLDEEKTSMISMPIVSKQLHVCEPLVSDDATMGKAILGLSKLATGEIKNAFDSEGNYIREIHKDGDILSASIINKFEEALETNTKAIKNGTGTSYDDTQIKTDINTIKTDLGTEKLTTTAKDVKGAVNEVAAQYKDIENTKADKNDLQTQKNRIDNLATLKAGSTTGDAELIDGRIGFNGITYSNIGESIRSQINYLNNNMNDLSKLKNEISFTFKENKVEGYLGKDGNIINTDGIFSIYTNSIKCNEGDVFLYKGRGVDNGAVCVFKKNGVVTGYKQGFSLNEYIEIIIPADVNEVIFGSFEYSDNVYFELKLKNETLKEKIENLDNDLVSFKNKVIFTFEKNQSVGYLMTNGEISDEKNIVCIYTNDIDCIPGDVFLYKGIGETNAVSCLFKKDNTIVSYAQYNSKNTYTEITIPSGVNKVVFGSFEYSTNIEDIIFDLRMKNATLEDKINDLKINDYTSSNILHGKKWFACGDSFTEGDFTGYTDENGLSGKNSPEIYDSVKGMYKTYPWWIAGRNNMTLINEAQCGTYFTNVENAFNPFSVSRYKAVPKDVDYITLMFGLNESHLSDEQIGTKTDTTNTTLCGAYNIVFEYFLRNVPYAKIGVIISDAWLPEKYANATIEICKYWGVPYLNLKGDDNITMGIGGKFNECSEVARTLRDKAFKVTDTNEHPNVKAHEFRSTIIENFLRSL